MKDKSYLKSTIASSTIVMLAALIENAILSNIIYLPAIPDLCLICVLFISLQNGKLFGEATGFFSGLCLDFLGAGPFGLNCLYRTVIGYLGGIFNKVIRTDGIFTPALLVLLASLVKALLLLLITILFPMIKIRFSPFTQIFLWELAENTLMGPVLFRLLGLFKKYIVVKTEAAI
ncbi:MAG: rod shape-determining protein MreD [Treponema sp.]|nr:rod shape-determining protein MreD [Treponema sp.]MCR5621058.1 rod shape-determining protein MreD [Treponema sp.]